MEVIGLDHVYLSVSDFARAEAWYDRVLRALGFKKGDKPIAGESHAHYFNRALQVSIRPAHRAGSHDPYAAGLHHLCFQVPDRGAVDEAWQTLRALGIDATEPRLYPEYNDEYYATFFADPDGIRLELVGRTRYREGVARRFEELEGFLNPWARLLERDRGKS